MMEVEERRHMRAKAKSQGGDGWLSREGKFVYMADSGDCSVADATTNSQATRSTLNSDRLQIL
jgi:hypothetical protein